MNTTTARFCAGVHEVQADTKLWQWDYGQKLLIEGLDLPTAFAVHFSNRPVQGVTKTQIGTDNSVTIPDEYLETGLPVYAFIYLHTGDSDGETEYKIIIYVNPRPQPSDETPTPAQQGTIDQLITALNEGVEQAKDSAEDAAREAASAEQAKLDAEGASGDSEAWAIGTRDGEAVPADDPAYQNNAKFYAALAAQGAEESGFAFFDIEEENGNMYVYISDNLAEDVSFQIDEQKGILEVIYS